MTPYTKGNRIYMPGLIKFWLTDEQENKIWLEKIAGLKRDYRVSIVINTSYSCFNELLLSHSVQTIIMLLQILSQIKIPYFDLVLSTSSSPIVLSINQNTQRALDPNSSDLSPALFSILSRNSDSCNMIDAILVAMKFKHIYSSKKS
jgi:PAX-interacting protein 1